MSESKRYRANPVVSFGDEGDDGAVLYNPDVDDVTIVNLAGKAIWQLLETPQTPEHIAAYLVETFQGCSVEQAAEDVEAFIQELLPDFLEMVDDD